MAKSSVPLPREHGAWAMVVGPAIVGLSVPPIGGVLKGASSGFAGEATGSSVGATAPSSIASTGGLPLFVGGTLLLVALLALFCLQYVVVRSVTAKRKDPSLPKWAVVYGAIGTIAGAVLVFVLGYVELLAIGAIAAIYFALHLVQVRKPGRREHRALGFELLTVAVLCLGAPAGAIVAGASATGAGALWAYVLSFLFFAGSVFHVRAIVRRLQKKSAEPESIRRFELARESVLWHAAIAVFVVVVGLGLFGDVGPDHSTDALAIRTGFLAVAFLPAIVRAMRTAVQLRRSAWNLKTIGFVELGCTVAFVVGAMVLLGELWIG
ncbi:MAG: YwiC-like family protein [Candidatus Eisenbacteria bacterium]|uniref:YwiC-like family protein n=1 Tax=Eiseniibacteriota bacterium TaxID=2212470 RepID=A0A956NHE8_UNCEI|nr:YwiC-like family protein [Candidatus Eisenbacteria bacterium]